MKFIFVDAYNVINCWPNLKKLRDLDFSIVRQKLIEIMENYAVFNGYKVFLVFDAYNSNIVGDRKTDVSPNLSIIYTKKGELADTYIERVIHKLGKKLDIMVVTSDYLEQQTIFQRGAYRVSALEFYEEVYNANKKISREIDKVKQGDFRFLLIDNLDQSIIDKLENIRRFK